jgi:hypothetical protein
VILRVGLGRKRFGLVVDVKTLGGVMNRAVLIVVVADRAIEIVIFKEVVKGFALRALGSPARRRHFHSCRDLRAARANQLAIDIHHAGVTGFDRTKLGVVADLGQMSLRQRAIDGLDKQLAGDSWNRCAVERERYVCLLF